MLNKLSDSWKDNLVNDVHNKSRFYANIRGVEYPAVSGTPTYAAPTDHRSSGSVNLTGGVMKYLVSLTQPFTIDCRIAPTAITSHDFIQFHETENDYTKRLKVFSIYQASATSIYYHCNWNESATHEINTINNGIVAVNDYIRLTFVFNNGTSYLYRNGKLISSGSTSAIVTNKNWMTVDATNTIVDYIRIIPNFAATDADVENNFEDVYNEEIFFPYNNQSTGFTRCQITKYVNGYNIDLPGEFKSTQAGLSLNNISGEFSADQYAAFSPENGSYNGTAAQSYLSRKIPIWIESWQDNKIQDIPDGVAGYWSMDNVPEIPDNTSGAIYIQDTWGTTDGWGVFGSGNVAVGDGTLFWEKTSAFSFTNKSISVPAGYTVRARVRISSGTPSSNIIYLSQAPNYDDSASIDITGKWNIVDFNIGASSVTSVGLFVGDYGSSNLYTLQIDWIYIGDGSYSTPLFDNSGNGRIGTIYSIVPSSGIMGKASSFYNDTSRANIGPIVLGDEQTLAVWYKRKLPVSVPADYRMLLSRYGVGEYISVYDDTYISVAFRDGASQFNVTSNTNVGDGNWHLIVATSGASGTTIYIDGQQTGYNTRHVDDSITESEPWYIGAWINSSSPIGDIDEAILFNKVLSQQDITNLYNMRLNRYNDAQEPDFEPIFVGNIAANSFARSTNVGDFSRISVQADSIIADIAKRIFRTGRKFEDYYLARTIDTGASLFHELVKLGTQKEVYNYATNASFENTTIGNSWAGTISRNNTHAFVGTYGGYINTATTVKTTVVTELTKYERFTFSVWAYSASAISITMQIRDMLATTPNGTTSLVNAHTGKGWQLLAVTHDVASSSSDRLECSITTTGTPALWLDAACLNYGDYKHMISANTNDGTSAVSQRADGVLTAYQICGAIGENVSYQHPWAVFAKDENAWEKLKQLSEASLARHLYVTPDGIIKLVTAATAPASSIATISNIAGISASTQGEQANKLKVSGVKITEKTDMRIWNLNDSNSLTGDTGAPSGSFQRTTGAGDYFPLLAEAPDGLECVYDKDVIEE